MERKNKQKKAYIFWAINVVSLILFSFIASPYWLYTTLAFIYLLSFVPAIVFSVLAHKKTKEERLETKNIRKEKIKYKRQSLGYKIFLIFVMSFIMISMIIPMIIGMAIESIALTIIGISIQILVQALFLVYFIYCKKGESILPIVMSIIGIPLLVFFLIYMLGVNQMSYPLVIISVITLVIFALTGNYMEGSESVLYLIDTPFQFGDSTFIMGMLISLFMIVSAIYFIIAIVYKSPKRKTIKVTIDEEGNKEITEEVEEK